MFRKNAYHRKCPDYIMFCVLWVNLHAKRHLNFKYDLKKAKLVRVQEYGQRGDGVAQLVEH